MAQRGSGLFPRAPILLSDALWFAWDHPIPILGLGLLGSAPFVLCLLLFFREAEESRFVPGTTAAAMLPLALGIGAVYFIRFPFRLALARFMAESRSGKPGSLWSALGFGFLQFPAAILYGSVSTIGWMLGLFAGVPYLLTFRASLAFHRFASTDESAWTAFRATGEVPIWRAGFAVLMADTVFVFGVVLVFLTAPQTALLLAEWLVRANVSGLLPLVSAGSLQWIGVVLACAVTLGEILWTVAFGLLFETWDQLVGGTDLGDTLTVFEGRLARGEAFE